MRYPDDVHDVTGVDRAGMERISLLRDAPYQEVVPMDDLSVSLPLDRDEHAKQRYYPDVEEMELPLDTEWFSLAKAHIPDAVKEYIHLLETGETKAWCKCPWILHPDDVNIPEGMCVHCGKEQETNFHDVGAIIDSEAVDKGFHRFQGRRIRRDLNNENPECPVHTKEGFILGFFEHLFKDQDEAPHTSGT